MTRDSTGSVKLGTFERYVVGIFTVMTMAGATGGITAYTNSVANDRGHETQLSDHERRLQMVEERQLEILATSRSNSEILQRIESKLPKK